MLRSPTEHDSNRLISSEAMPAGRLQAQGAFTVLHEEGLGAHATHELGGGCCGIKIAKQPALLYLPHCFTALLHGLHLTASALECT